MLKAIGFAMLAAAMLSIATPQTAFAQAGGVQSQSPGSTSGGMDSSSGKGRSPLPGGESGHGAVGSSAPTGGPDGDASLGPKGEDGTYCNTLTDVTAKQACLDRAPKK